MRLLLIAAVVLFASCTKTDDTRIPLNPPATPTTPPVIPPVTPGTSTSIYISKVFIVDTTKTAPADTIGRASFYYDAQKRPLKIESFIYSNNVLTEKYIMNYQYAGTDTLASRSIEQNLTYSGTTVTNDYRDTVEYIFSAGKLVYDSSHYTTVPGGSYYSVSAYTYNTGNMISIAHRNKSFASPVVNTRTEKVRQTIVGGEITYQLDSTFQTVPAPSPGQFQRLENTVTSYLSNPNPMARFCDPIRKPYFLDDVGFASIQSSSRKLYTQHRYVFDAGTASSSSHTTGGFSYQYTFRTDGYPTIIREVQDDNGTLNIARYIIQYQ